MIVQLLWILETRFWCTILNALWNFSNPLRVKLLYRGLNIYIPSLKSFNKWWWRFYNVLIWQGAELFLLGSHNNVQETKIYTNWAISKQADYQFKQLVQFTLVCHHFGKVQRKTRTSSKPSGNRKLVRILNTNHEPARLNPAMT